MELKIYHQQDKQDLYCELKRFALPYKVKIDPIFQKRTDSQNRYYHKYIKKALADYLGEYEYKMHERLLSMFACVGDGVDDNGNAYLIVESTAGMDSMRMEEFNDKCRQWAMTEHKYYIPLPGEAFSEDEEIKVKFIYQ